MWKVNLINADVVGPNVRLEIAAKASTNFSPNFDRQNHFPKSNFQLLIRHRFASWNSQPFTSVTTLCLVYFANSIFYSPPQSFTVQIKNNCNYIFCFSSQPRNAFPIFIELRSSRNVLLLLRKGRERAWGGCAVREIYGKSEMWARVGCAKTKPRKWFIFTLISL